MKQKSSHCTNTQPRAKVPAFASISAIGKVRDDLDRQKIRIDGRRVGKVQLKIRTVAGFGRTMMLEWRHSSSGGSETCNARNARRCCCEHPISEDQEASAV